MHGTIGFECDLRQCLDLVGLGYIGTHGQYLGTAGLEFCLSLLEGALLDIGQHDLHPLLRTLSGQRTSDAAGRSGDNGHFPLEILHVAPLLSHRKLYLPSTQLVDSGVQNSSTIAAEPCITTGITLLYFDSKMLHCFDETV